MNLDFVGVGVDICQLLVHRHWFAELHRSLKHFLQAFLGAVHVLQVQQGHPHVQFLLLLPGPTQGSGFNSTFQQSTMTSSIYSFSGPERDGFEGPLSHSSGLLDLRGLQVMSHVLQPEQGAVGRG